MNQKEANNKQRTPSDDEALHELHDAESSIDADDQPDATEVDLEALEEENLSDDVHALLETIERERDAAIDARKRALADYANFQKRAAENEQRAFKDGQMAIIRALLPVLDHFDLALNQDVEKVSVEQLLGGVKIVRQELLKALERFGVSRIEPDVGEEFDPNRHEAMMRQSHEGVAPNHIVAVYQPGFEAGERVIRPAKVAVAPDNDG